MLLRYGHRHIDTETNDCVYWECVHLTENVELKILTLKTLSYSDIETVDVSLFTLKHKSVHIDSESMMGVRILISKHMNYNDNDFGYTPRPEVNSGTSDFGDFMSSADSGGASGDW